MRREEYSQLIESLSHLSEKQRSEITRMLEGERRQQSLVACFANGRMPEGSLVRAVSRNAS